MSDAASSASLAKRLVLFRASYTSRAATLNIAKMLSAPWSKWTALFESFHSN